jgi:hypothetical protein
MLEHGRLSSSDYDGRVGRMEAERAERKAHLAPVMSHVEAGRGSLSCLDAELAVAHRHSQRPQSIRRLEFWQVMHDPGIEVLLAGCLRGTAWVREVQMTAMARSSARSR